MTDTKFDPTNPWAPAMAITDRADADAYFKLAVGHICREFRFDREAAERHVRRSLGYFAGYYDHDTRDRVERLFDCEHPVFGSIAKNGPPTAEQAMRAGINLARNRS